MTKEQEIHKLAQRLKYSQLLQTLVQSEGYQEWAAKTRLACEETGRAAVYPMIKSDLLIDRLTRANERLRMLEELEILAAKTDSLKAKWSELTGQEKV